MAAHEQNEASSRPAVVSTSGRKSRAVARVFGRSARRTQCALGAIAGLTCVVNVVLGAAMPGPFVFQDELVYERSAWSLWQHGHVELFGKVGLAYSPLYSLVVAPLYGLASGAPQADAGARSFNAVLMAFAVFPTYAIARFVMPRRAAVVVALLGSLAPLGMYANLMMSENLAYPLFLLAIWAMLRALREPTPRNDLLLLASIVAASATRLQLVVLFPAAATACLIFAGVSAGSRGDRIAPALRRAVTQHRVFLAPVALATAAALTQAVAAGGSLPLAGDYASTGRGRASPLHVAEVVVQHLAGLDFAVGIAPFAAALLGAYALRRAGFPRRELLFASVVVSAALWLLLEVGFYAAAAGAVRSTGVALPAAPPRIRERYLIYLVPLFLTAFVAVLRSRRIPLRAVALAAVAAAVLPAAIPFNLDINHTIAADSFSLQIFGVAGDGQPLHAVSHATTTALIIGGMLASHFALSMSKHYRRSPVVMLAVVFVAMSGLVFIRLYTSSGGLVSATVPAHKDWVDRALGGKAAVMVEGRGATRAELVMTAFYNLSVDRAYYTCKMAFGDAFGERPLTVGRDGALRTPTGPLEADYAVVPTRLGVRGRVLARNPKGGLVLVAPTAGELVVTRKPRANGLCSG